MNIGPLIRSAEELYSAPTDRKHLDGRGENRGQLLELRTESGPIYVCPSGWQRIRLLWTFRHFHVLAPQVLSRRDQRLIEKLCRSALVTPPLPVASDRVFGVVERVRTKSTESVPPTVTVRTERVRPQALPAKPGIPDLPRQGLHVVRARSVGGGREDRFRQWGALGMLTAVCLVVILARVYGVSLFARTAPIRKPATVSGPVRQAATPAPPTVPLPSVEKPQHRVAPPAPEPTLVARKSEPAAMVSKQSTTDSRLAAVVESPAEPPAIAPSGASERLFVSDLPQGHFVQPVVSDPNLVGELRLKALIGADGSVKDVTLVSGNPRLAEAGMRAVRRWHYSQYQALGRQGEGETLIRMNFFGQDAVSVTTVAR